MKRWWNIPFDSVQVCCTSLLDFNTCLSWPSSKFIRMDFCQENIHCTAAAIMRYSYFVSSKNFCTMSEWTDSINLFAVAY
jgi:hypothetical protein